jgi:hypothetical protein
MSSSQVILFPQQFLRKKGIATVKAIGWWQKWDRCWKYEENLNYLLLLLGLLIFSFLFMCIMPRA